MPLPEPYGDNSACSHTEGSGGTKTVCAEFYTVQSNVSFDTVFQLLYHVLSREISLYADKYPQEICLISA